MESNKKARYKKTDTSLLPRNFEWCRRTITEVNEQYKEFLTQEYDGQIVNIVRANNNNSIDEQKKFNRTLGLECNRFDTLLPGLECNQFDALLTPSMSNQPQSESRKFEQHQKMKNSNNKAEIL